MFTMFLKYVRVSVSLHIYPLNALDNETTRKQKRICFSGPQSKWSVQFDFLSNSYVHMIHLQPHLVVMQVFLLSFVPPSRCS